MKRYCTRDASKIRGLLFDSVRDFLSSSSPADEIEKDHLLGEKKSELTPPHEILAQLQREQEANGWRNQEREWMEKTAITTSAGQVLLEVRGDVPRLLLKDHAVVEGRDSPDGGPAPPLLSRSSPVLVQQNLFPLGGVAPREENTNGGISTNGGTYSTTPGGPKNRKYIKTLDPQQRLLRGSSPNAPEVRGNLWAGTCF